MRCVRTTSFLRTRVVAPTCLLVLMVGTLPCWGLHMDHIAATRALKTRSARGADSPPTVTSLKPPDRSGHGRGVGLSVRSEEGGDTAPPVVASRSPASTSYSKDTSRFYHRSGTNVNQDSSSPMATATSGSNLSPLETAGITGRRSLPDATQRSDSTAYGDVGVRGVPGWSASSPWNRHDASHDDGGWSPATGQQDESAAAESVWDQQVNRRPSLPYGRPDTFGHKISEDLSHLETEHSPRQNNRRVSGDVSPIQFSSASSGRYGNYPHKTYNASPNNGWHNSRVASGSGNERSSTRFRNWDPEEPSNTSPQPSYVDFNAHEYPPRGSYNYPTRSHDSLPHSALGRGGNPYNPKTGPDPALPPRPHSIREVTQMMNLSSTNELLNLLQKRGITFSELIDYMDEGATRDEILQLLGGPSVTTSTKSPEELLPEVDEDDEGDFDARPYEVPMNTNPRQEMNDGDVASKEDPGSSLEERRKNRKERKRNRGRGKGGRRKKGRKDRKRLPDLVYSTDILPSPSDTPNFPVDTDVRLTETLGESEEVLPRTSTVAPAVLVSDPTDSPVSTDLPKYLGSSPTRQATIIEDLPEIPSNPLAPQINATQDYVLLPTIETNKETTTTAPVTTTVAQSVSRQTPMYTTTVKASLPEPVLPSDPRDPFMDSITFTPGVRPSEVSIQSITVMKMPSGQGEETVPEVVRPDSRRPKHRKPLVKAHTPPHRNVPKYTDLEEPEFEIGSRHNFVREKAKDEYQFPIKGLLIISGVLGAMAVFTLVILISYCIIKCSKPPAINNYQVNEQKAQAK